MIYVIIEEAAREAISNKINESNYQKCLGMSSIKQISPDDVSCPGV